MKIKQKELAAKHGVSPAFICRLLKGEKTTDRWELARDLAKVSKRKAITFTHSRHHEIFKRAYPRIFK